MGVTKIKIRKPFSKEVFVPFSDPSVCEFYQLLNVKGEVNNHCDSSEGPWFALRGKRQVLDLFHNCVSSAEPNARHMGGFPQNVNGIGLLSFLNNSTQALLISR